MYILCQISFVWLGWLWKLSRCMLPLQSNCGDALLTNNICMKYDQVVIIVKQHGCDLFKSVYI